MVNVTTVKAAIKDFDEKFKRPKIESLIQCFHATEVTENNWADLWAEGGLFRVYADAPCVYFFFDKDEDLRYIGKAEIFGTRMGSHFHGEGSKWRGRAKTIGILPVPKESWFEILAVEAYLIRALQPPENSSGKK